MTVTSWPSRSSWAARPEPARPQPRMMTFTYGSPARPTFALLYSKRRLLLDAAICLVAVLFVLAGYRRGLILELGSVAGFFAGLAAASALWYPAALALHRVIDNQVAAAVAGFVGVFVVA